MADVSMAARYAPHEVEGRLMAEWLERSAFRASIERSEPVYSIVIPPPNVTGSLHMGHALNGTIQDVLIRYHHMKGLNTLWLVGTDHAGIATQNKVEAQLAGEGLTRWDIGREAFEERVWAWKEKYGSAIIEQLERLGCACDYDRERFTMDEGYHNAVLRVFVDLYEKGEIYRDLYLVNWCPRCGSAISDLEVEHEEREGGLYHIRYPVRDRDEHLVVATTRPETMLGDTGVAVHPDDSRYGHLVGKRIVVPLVEREVPIIADEHVDPEFGTGALKITPGHDPHDWEIGRRHDLPAVSVVDFKGLMNEDAGEFEGMTVDEARRSVVRRLEEEGLLAGSERHRHAVGTCYRCGTTIEPLLSKQWFMDMKRLAQPAIECVEDGRVRFVPERWAGVYLDWMRSIRPWCISRQLWWGHRLPVWYCDECDTVVVTTEGPESCPECGGSVTQDEDVLDTWFSSALWPFATLGWPEDTRELELFYPTSVLSTARDIIYLWVARMIMMGLEYMDDVPFHDVLIHPTILASDGRRMSKSLGTGVDPLDLVDEFGADATRFGLLYMSSVQDVRFSPERIEMGRNFANKVWNAARLIVQGAPESTEAQVTEATLADRWIFSRLQTVSEELAAAYESYEFAEAARVAYRFVWNEVCDWYLEIAKARLYGGSEEEQREVAGNLTVLFEQLMGLLHPMMPFVTQEIYRHLPQVREDPAADLLSSEFPQRAPALRDPSAEAAMDVFVAVVSGLRSARDELQVPRAELGRVYLLEEEPGGAGAIQELEESFRQLSGCELAGVDDAGKGPPQGRYASVDAPGVRAFLDLSGLVDIEKERQRLESRAEKARADAERSRRKLADEGFVTKAPADVVEEERARLAQAEALLEEVARQYRERVGGEFSG